MSNNALNRSLSGIASFSGNGWTRVDVLSYVLSMASLWKHPESKFFFACFTDRTGRRLKRSTKETNRAKAQRIAEAYEQAARKKQTARQVRTVITDLHKAITGEDVVSLTVREHSQNWLAEKKGTAPATRAFYRGSVNKFLSYLGERADVEIGDIDQTTIVAYRNHLINVVSVKSANHDLKTVKMLFKTARRDQLIADDPAAFVEAVKGKSDNTRRPFTLDEIKRVMAVAGDEWRSMITFGLYTGLRISDVATLRWSNIDLVNLMITLRIQKTGKSIKIPIAGPLARHLENLPSSDDPRAPLHPRANAVWEREGKTGRLGNQFAELLTDAGLRGPTTATGQGIKGRRQGHELSFHALRHSAVSMMKDAGIPEAVVMEIVGHSSKEMSAHYTHVGDDAMKRAVDSLPSLDQ